MRVTAAQLAMLVEALTTDRSAFQLDGVAGHAHREISPKNEAINQQFRLTYWHEPKTIWSRLIMVLFVSD
jgi:hypothetical protein